MDKQILYQYIDACELIKETEEEIRRIKRQRKRIEHDVVKGSSHDFPYTPTNFHVEGVGYSVIRDPRSLEIQDVYKRQSPNRYKELIHYAGYLEVMDTGQALTRFFQRDSTKANNLTLYPNMEDEFWICLLYTSRCV